MPNCAIKNCKSSLGPNCPYYSYNFPKVGRSPERFSRWRRHTDLVKVNSGSRVCSIHFKLEDFDESDIMKIRLTPNLFKKLTPKLKEGAVPTLNLGGGEDETSRSRVELRDVGDILAGGGQSGDSQPSASWMFPACEIKVEEGESFERSTQRNSVAIQCEFGAEVYRGFESVDK